MTETAVRPGLAAVSVLGGMFALGITDNFVPFISETGSLWQFHMLRGVMALVLLAGLAAAGAGVLRPVRPGAVLARSLFPATAMLIYFGCLSVLPIGGDTPSWLASTTSCPQGPWCSTSPVAKPSRGTPRFWISVRVARTKRQSQPQGRSASQRSRRGRSKRTRSTRIPERSRRRAPP